MKHLDQASLAPMGTEERTRLSQVKTSHTPGAPSASGRVASETPSCLEEKVRKQEGQRPLKTEAQYSLAHLAGTNTLPAKPVHRDVTEELPREVSIDVGAHGAEGDPPVTGARVIGAGGNRTEKSRARE